MDLFLSFFLLALGFAVGISGALLPGPLTVYTIKESLEKGKWVGVLVIAGHAIVETFIFAALALGLAQVISDPQVTAVLGVVGGAALILMAASSVRDGKEDVEKELSDPGLEKRAGKNVVLGGIVFTAFNPGFPVWWATAGSRLLLEGYGLMGYVGMALVFIGHIAADLGWFTFLSFTVSKGKNLIFKRRIYSQMRRGLAAVLLVIGVYFLWSGTHGLRFI